MAPLFPQSSIPGQAQEAVERYALRLIHATIGRREHQDQVAGAAAQTAIISGGQILTCSRATIHSAYTVLNNRDLA